MDDMGMSESRDSPRLFKKFVERIIRQMKPEDLDGGGRLEIDVFRQINIRKASLTEKLDKPVIPQLFPYVRGHRKNAFFLIHYLFLCDKSNVSMLCSLQHSEQHLSYHKRSTSLHVLANLGSWPILVQEA